MIGPLLSGASSVSRTEVFLQDDKKVGTKEKTAPKVKKFFNIVSAFRREHAVLIICCHSPIKMCMLLNRSFKVSCSIGEAL